MNRYTRQRSFPALSIRFALFALLALGACGNGEGGGSGGQGGSGGSGGQVTTGSTGTGGQGGSGGSGGQGSNLCTQTGGTEAMALCCTSSGDFPDSCLTGACGCSPQNSHMVKVCNCPTGQCFDAAMGCK